MKKIVISIIALVFALYSAVGAFAYEQKSSVYPWMASFNKTGQLNLYLAGGFYYLGFDATGGPEIILGNIDLSGIPLEWGVMGRATIGFGSFAGASWIDWGAAPMVTLHWGTDFGKGLKFEWYAGVGVGFYGTTGTYYTWAGLAGPFFGFASADGIAWHFSENASLILDYTYTGWVSVYGLGVKLNM